MDAYGGTGLRAIREWDETPIATVAWLIGCRSRRLAPKRGPDPVGGMTADDMAVLKALGRSGMADELRKKWQETTGKHEHCPPGGSSA